MFVNFFELILVIVLWLTVPAHIIWGIFLLLFKDLLLGIIYTYQLRKQFALPAKLTKSGSWEIIKFGIFGVLAGTIASLTVRMFLMVHYSCRKLLKVNPLRMYRKMLVNIMILLAFLYACSKLTIPSQNYFIMAAFAVPVTIVSVLIYGAAVFVYDRDTVHFVSAYLKNRFHKG